MPNGRSSRARLLLVTACVVALSSVPSAQAFDRTGWLKDYATLKQALERRYANLAWFASPEGGVDLPALDRRTLALLKSANSDDDAREALLDFVRRFHDGHFSQLPALAPAAPTAATSAPPAPEYDRQDAASGCAALNYAPYDRPQFSLPFESLPRFRLIADGITTPFRAGIVTGYDGAKIAIVRIPSFEEAADHASCVRAWARDEVWDAQGKLIRSRLRQTVERAWYETLAQLLRTFSAERAAAVVVDIGNNSGGDDSGDIAARLFTTKPLRSAPLWMVHDAAASAPYFEEQLGSLRTAQELEPKSPLVADAMATFTAQKERLQEDGCSLRWVWRERRPWSRNGCRRLLQAGSAGGPLDYLAPAAVENATVARVLHWPAIVTSLWGVWTGPLYVLTDNKTYSSAEMFAAVLQNNGAARIIGARTGGDGCGFMSNPGPVVLPHSGLRFRVPNCVRMRADGTDEVAGVRPDIAVVPTEGENARTRAMRVLSEVRGGLAVR
jgi:hypothetical protein